MFLFVNTALKEHEIIYGSVDEILFQRSFKGGREGEIPFYKALKDLKAEFPNLSEECEYLIVLTGPGPFTSLRLGISAVNTLALLWQKNVIGISTYDWLKLGEGDLPVLLPAGGHFVHLFDKKGHEVVDVENLGNTRQYIGQLPKGFEGVVELKEIKSSVEKLKEIDLSQFEELDQVIPWYGKEVVV